MRYLASFSVTFIAAFLMIEIRSGWTNAPELADDGAYALSFLYWMNGFTDTYGQEQVDYLRGIVNYGVLLWPFNETIGLHHGVRVLHAISTAAIVPAALLLATHFTTDNRRLLLTAVGVAGLAPVSYTHLTLPTKRIV